MAIYIKGAELPTSCRSCPHEIGGDCYGGKAKYIKDVDDDEEQFRNSRHPDCPLIYIPEPHGRLIDADLLAKEMRKGQQTSKAKVWALLTKYAPTVIERSE